MFFIKMTKEAKKKKGATSKKSSSKGSETKKEKIKKNIKKQAKKIHPLTLKEKIKDIKTKHKIIFFSIMTILIVLFIIFGARLYLLFNFLLGNDTLVQLTASQQDFFMTNSETKTVEFQSYVSTNIFCEATCDYTFRDLSTGYVIDKNSFNTSLSNPHKLDYSIVAPEIGEGQVLYHFEVSCQSQKSSLCRTDEEEKKRSLLVALNYELSEEQKEFKEESSEELQEIIFQTDELNKIKLENERMKDILEDVILVEDLPNDNLSDIENELDEKLQDWKKYNYEIVLRDDLFSEINETRKLLVEINDNLTNKIKAYSNLAENISSVFIDLKELDNKQNITEADHENIVSLIDEFNNAINETRDPFNLSEKRKKFERLDYDTLYVKTTLNYSSYGNYTYPELLSPQMKTIEKPFLSNYSSGRFLQSEEPMCCYMGNCDICCMDNCIDDPDKYPILLIHGHSFNDAISAESSLGDMRSIQEEMTKDGVIDGGYILLNNFDNTDTFARTNRQIVFASSYYFDLYQNTESSVLLQTKAESLDTYALRLNDLVKTAKDITNRDKVYIVAHSMGGLVSRRYMQIFGSSDVEKLIMIGTANHGIDGYILSSCSIFGANSHCNAMDEDSLFINKLTYGRKPETNVSMIIGLGCPIDGMPADGIVKNESAYLPWAKNHYVEGNCSGVDFLHRKMLNVEEYPETYEIIKKELHLENNNLNK